MDEDTAREHGQALAAGDLRGPERAERFPSVRTVHANTGRPWPLKVQWPEARGTLWPG